MGLSRLVVAVLVALTVSGCTGGDKSPPDSPQRGATSPAASGPTYKATSFDLCNNTDIKAFVLDLRLTVDSTDNSPSAEGPGAACMWRIKSADGNPSMLRVQAVVHRSVEDASRSFKGQQFVTNMKSDGPISGLGDQAEGRTVDSESDQGFKQSEYMVHLRTGNMTVKTWIILGAKEFTPKQTLATRMDALTRATLTTVSSAFK